MNDGDIAGNGYGEHSTTAVAANQTLLSASCTGSKSGGPTDNPVASMYGNATYPWVNRMVNWSCVFNVKDFHDDLESAQKAAVASGGGVVYLPAGKYTLKENFVLASGVVLRGEPTGTEKARNNKEAGNLAPKTVLECPDREHMGIFNSDPKAMNMGVINLDLSGCAVMLWPALNSPSKFNLKSYFYYATDVLGMGSNKLVFGNRIRDVSYKYPDPASPTGNIWPYRWSAAIAAYSENNTLVANNLLAKSDKFAKTTIKLDVGKPTEKTVTTDYPYDNRYGIDAGQVLLGGVIGAYSKSGKCPSSPGSLTPKCAPWYFSRGVIVRDNYIYMNGRVGISWSGGGDGKTIGSGPQIVSNHVEVAKGTTCWTVDGVHLSKGSDTNENRGFNQEGYANNVSANTANVNRQLVSDGHYTTVDGEGLLHQAASGNDGYRNIWHGNDFSSGSSGPIFYYKLYNVEDSVISNNIAGKDSPIGIVVDEAHHNVKNVKCSDNKPKCTGV
eukprot:scpid60111/ scgid6246/ 